MNFKNSRGTKNLFCGCWTLKQHIISCHVFVGSVPYKRQQKHALWTFWGWTPQNLAKLHNFLPLPSSPVFFSSFWTSGCPSKVSLDWLFSHQPSLKTAFEYVSNIKNILLHAIFLTLFSVFGNVVKHCLSLPQRFSETWVQVWIIFFIQFESDNSFIWEVTIIVQFATCPILDCMRVSSNRTVVTSQINHYMIWIGWQKGWKHISQICQLCW